MLLLQINTNGAWRTLMSFEATNREDVEQAASSLFFWDESSQNKRPTLRISRGDVDPPIALAYLKSADGYYMWKRRDE